MTKLTELEALLETTRRKIADDERFGFIDPHLVNRGQTYELLIARLNAEENDQCA